MRAKLAGLVALGAAALLLAACGQNSAEQTSQTELTRTWRDRLADSLGEGTTQT